MSRTRRKFSSQFKADLCVELLKGEKDLNSLASENSLLPNLLRNWKKDFLEKCSKAFDDTSENYWEEKYLAEHREKKDYARKVGHLAMKVDWLKKIWGDSWTRIRRHVYSEAFRRVEPALPAGNGRRNFLCASLPYSPVSTGQVSTISTGTINLLKRNLRARL